MKVYSGKSRVITDPVGDEVRKLREKIAELEKAVNEQRQLPKPEVKK
jgi:hypothetical protein